MFRFIALILLTIFVLGIPVQSNNIPVNPDGKFPLPGQGTLDPDANTQSYTPGLGLGGISVNDTSFYEIPPEKCLGESTAEIIKEFGLTDRIFLFKTSAGYGVAELAPTYVNLQTGVRRKADGTVKRCSIDIGMQFAGEIDCKGKRNVRREPYENCDFEAKIWAHSLNEGDAYTFAISKLVTQFKNYREKCIIPAGPKSIQERMLFN
ncbi:MAG: hypothetical protein SFT81_04530 [Candidatus Caenarcaniphilales bacterium]|nr:hypothetical protein [Candidatus Caenarcaniphilales bacterium]